MPVGSSLAGRKLYRYFATYANTLGFNTTWQFFSPGPSPMFYIEYEPDFGTDEDWTEESPAPFTYPPKREGFSWSDGWNRRLFGMRFLALHPHLMPRFFIPFLCREHPGAKAIDVRSTIDQIEDLERSDRWTELEDSTRRIDLPRERYSCEEADE